MSIVVPLPQDRPPEPRGRRVAFRRLARFLAAVSALCAVAAFPASAIFDLHTVTVTGNAAVQADEVLRRAGLRPSINAFRIDAAAIRGRLLEDPRIEDVTVAMAFPHQLLLQIRERAPVAALVVGESYLLLSSGGVAIAGSAEAGSLPVLAVDRLDQADVAVGAVLRSPDARLGAQIAGTLPALLKDRVAALHVDGAGEVVLALRDGTTVRLGGSKGIAGRLEMVPDVLAAITARGLQVESVDVRFPANVIVQPVRATGVPAQAGVGQENPPLRGIQPAMHRPSIP